MVAVKSIVCIAISLSFYLALKIMRMKMGDMADYANEVGFEQMCHEQDILDRGDILEMYDAGLVDENGAMDMSSPPGLISFGRPPRKNLFAGCACPSCGNLLVQRVNSKTEAKFLGCSGFPRCKFSVSK